MKFREDYFPKWLEEVKEKLLSLNINGKHVGKTGRVSMFNEPLVLDEKSWRSYFDEGMLPYQAVKEDLELPWIETKQHHIL